MNKNYRQNLGKWGEAFAEDYLMNIGYILVQHNYRCSFGEADLVMQIGPNLAFIEVKTRRSARYGQAESAITPRKLKAMYAVAQQYLLDHPDHNTGLQLDVLVIDLSTPGTQQIRHYPNIACA